MCGNQPEDQALRNHRIEYINRRWKQLYDLEKERADQAIKYPFLINSGGAVTVLSFMGASEKVRTALGPILGLSCFVVGIILIGVFNIIQYYHMAKLFTAWKSDSEKYFENPAEWTNIIKNDKERSKPRIWAHIVAHGSFVMFVVGCIIGVIEFFK
jgi:uncharacterized membrane protein